MPPRKPKAPALEAGTYPARVVLISSLGIQDQGEWKGEKKSPALELLVTYELLDEFMPDEDGDEDTSKPRWFSENFALYSLDSDLAKSTKRYFALDPEKEFGGDWSKLIGTPCTVTLVQNPNKQDPTIIYNKIASVSKMREKDAAKAPDLVNPSVVFDYYEPDMGEWDKLPQWIRNKMTEDALDFEGSALQGELKSHKSEDKKEKLGNNVLYFETGKSDYALRKTLQEAGIQAIDTEDHIDPLSW